MKNKIFIFFTILFFYNITHSQSIIPLSRTDSALIKQYENNYQEYLSKGDLKEASRNLDLNATLYWKHNYYTEAISYFNKSIKLNTQLGNQNGIAGINSNLALIYADNKEYQKAYDFFEKTLAVRKSKGEKIGVISALINESVVLNKMKKFNISVEKLEEALSYALEMNDEKQMRSIYGMLSETYQKAGNSEQAIVYYNYYKTFNDYVTDKVITETNDKLRAEQMQKQLVELENKNKQLEIEKQNLLIDEQEKEIGTITKEQKQLIDSLSKQEMALELIHKAKEIKDLENKQLIADKRRQNQIIIIISIALIIVFISLIWLFVVYRQKQKLNKLLINKNALINHQKEEISAQRDDLADFNVLLKTKNQQITSSINYAKRIQTAILSKSKERSHLFDESYLVYMPRDIVAGDFYYFQKINGEKIIVIGDCTGHGVPGAFLTILGYNILNTIIIDKKIIDPAKILHELDKQFFLMLNQQKTDIGDGMDVSICIVNQDNTKIKFAAAKNPLIMVTENETKYIKASPFSIGYSAFFENIEKKFKTKTFDIVEPTWCYLFSDGITDQFNIERKKYSRKRLLNNLGQIFNKNADNQEEFITSEINTWKGSETTSQTDDIIFHGFFIK